MNNSDEKAKKISFQDIMSAIKDLTLQERRLLEKELVLMRLSTEFGSIRDKLAMRRAKKGSGKK